MSNIIFDDDMLSKRHSVSSFNSLNTFKSMSTYQTYITFATGNNVSGTLNRNESRRLLDKLKFTPEEELLIKTLKNNTSKPKLVDTDTKVHRNQTSIGNNENGDLKDLTASERLRLNKIENNNAFRKVSFDPFADFKSSKPQESSFKIVSTKYDTLDASDRFSKPSEGFSNEKIHNRPKTTHKKTRSWSISNSKYKGEQESLEQIIKDEPHTGSVFVKQHKKKNSSFSLKNLFKKPNSSIQPTQPMASPTFAAKYDTFHSFEHFQNNGNDEEFMNHDDNEMFATFEERNKDNVSENESQISQKRKNLISSEVQISNHSVSSSFSDLDDEDKSIQILSGKIDDYMNKAILLKQQNKLTESTDCLLLSILEYKKKYMLLRKLSRNDSLQERTPFLLYGIALKMGIGCNCDLDSSIENLKIACGLLPPVDFDNEDVLFDRNIADEKLAGYLDFNNLLIPEKFLLFTEFEDSGIIGPAFYELALNYLHSFLTLSVNKDATSYNNPSNYSLNQIQEGLKYLSESILIYNHYDSFPVLLEIYAKGIKMSKIYVINANRTRYKAWLKICNDKNINIPHALSNCFSALPTAFALKRNDTLERLNDFNSNIYSSSDDDEQSSCRSNSTASIVLSGKNSFEEGVTAHENESDDDLSDIMATYL